MKNNLPWWGFVISILCPLAGWYGWGLLKDKEGYEEAAKQSAYMGWIGFAINWCLLLLV